MPDIFISYARADEPVARRYAERFSEAGLEVWWDNHLRSGEDWDQAIEDALRSAGAVVVLWSPDAVKSRWVRAEATVAQRGGTLVPAIIAPCELPIVFEMTQTADLSHWSGDPEDGAWHRFLTDVASRAGRDVRSASHVSRATPAKPAHKPAAGERRRVTVLACTLDLGAADLEDPEDRIELVSAAHQALRATLAPFAGQVLDGHGEGLTALFGMSRAREDDALRAIDAALAAKDAIAELSRSESQPIGLHCGLRTGTVILEGEAARPLGGAIDEAHRIVASAQSGEIIICAITNNLVDGYFPVSEAGADLMRVDGPHAAETRFELARNRGLSGFVGRAEELAILRDAREQAGQGSGQVVSLVAEAGSGKSRLSHEFKQECIAAGMRVIEGSAKVNSGSRALVAVLELFRSFFGLSGKEPRDQGRAAIESWIELNEPKLASALPLLYEFLSLAPDGAAPTGLEPDMRQRQLVALFRHLVSLAGKDTPAMVLVEDLHWLDESSAQFLEQVVEGQARSRSLLLLNYRPEFRASWLQGSYCRQISLRPLAEGEVESLLSGLVGDDSSTAPLHGPILERTKGNPFFIEEIVRSLAETGELVGEKGAYRFVGDIEKLGVPDTVKSVLAARIDRLDHSSKAVLQAASVVGKDFDEPVLAEICDLDAGELGQALTNLQRNEFIEETEIFPVNRYSFRHPLTQETAMGSLLRKHRRSLHSRIAAVLEASDPAQLDEQAAMIALHWEEGGEKARAAPWYARAAEWVISTDYAAATTNWRKVREMIGTKPADEAAIGLAIMANVQLLNLNFRVAVDLEFGRELLEEGKALAALVGDEKLELQQSMMFSRIQCGAGDLPGYLANARRNLAAAIETGDEGLILVGTIMLIDGCNYSNLFDEVIAIADAECEKYPRDLPRETWATGFNPYTFFTFMRGGALGWSGRYEEMLEQFEETYRLSTEDGTPEVTCWLLFLRSVFATAADDEETARRSIEEFRELSDKAGVPLNVAHRHLADADFAIYEGRHDDAIVSAEKAHAFFAVLERQWEAFALMLHARALLGKGEFDAAEAMGRKATASADKAGVPQMSAAGLMVAADAIMRRDGTDGAERAGEDLARARRLMEDGGALVLQPGLERVERRLQTLRTSAHA